MCVASFCFASSVIIPKFRLKRVVCLHETLQTKPLDPLLRFPRKFDKTLPEIHQVSGLCYVSSGKFLP
jgi:hypothetical protein